MYKVKTLNKISPVGTDLLHQLGCETGDALEAPDALLVRSASLHDMTFDPATLCIARAGVGVNNIPIDRCTERGIAVFNTPGANAEAVKELVVCALVLSSRDIVGGIEWVKSIADQGTAIPGMVEKGKSAFVGPEIMGKTIGIIGLGAIGARVANAVVSLGMKVYGYDPYLSVDAAWQLSSNILHAEDLDTIYRNCDYIMIQVHYTDETHNMINAAAIDKMRDGVRILNYARGELVDDDAILAAIDCGKVARYITDFPNEKLIGTANVIATPHLGASTPESEEKCAVFAAQELYDYLENGNVVRSVNLPDVNLERMGVCRVCVIHQNVPRMINKFLDLIGAENINVEHMINKPRGDIAYTIIDTGSEISAEIEKAIAGMKEVLRVRVIH